MVYTEIVIVQGTTTFYLFFLYYILLILSIHQLLGAEEFSDSSIICVSLRFRSRTSQFLEAGSEISIVLGRFLEIQVALPEHVQHQLLGFILLG